MSVIGCGHKAAATQYCNGGDSGPIVGQLSSVELSPTLAVQGESLNYGQIGQGLSATGYDCKGSVVSLGSIIYATTDASFADINPSSGQVCGGTWNRNSGGNIPDYLLCTAPNYTAAQQAASHLAYITATANGITSNAVPVYVHSTITNIVFGKSASLCGTSGGAFIDPDTTCCPADPNTVLTGIAAYDGQSCISQNSTAQISARIYAGTQNITCQAGHLNFGTQGASGIVTLDQNGVGTANQPGSTTITAELANSSSASSIGYFSTCPPASITIAPVGQTVTNGGINVALYNSQPFTTTAVDTKGVTLTGLNLTFESTNPQLVTGSSTVSPQFPGTVGIVAACLPPSCNPSSADQLGLNGNGKSVTSNSVNVTAAGTSTTEIFIGSTDSQYVLPIDFSTNTTGTLVKLPFKPNSMMTSPDGSTIYFGSDQGLMTLSTATNSVSGANQLIPGTVIGVSPTGATVVVTDATRQVIELVSGSSVASTYGGVGSHASFSPDGSTIYITTVAGYTNGDQLLTYSSNSNWQKTPIAGTSGNTAKVSGDTAYNDVTVMVPFIGAYFAGDTSTDGRSYCPRTTTANAAVTPPVEANVYTPLADVEAAPIQRIAATIDQKHILGANLTTVTDLTVTSEQPVCTVPSKPLNGDYADTNFVSTVKKFTFAGVTPALITGVVPSNNSVATFVTFTGAGNGKAPYYLPNVTTPVLNYLTLSTALGTPSAPVAGVFSSDNFTFYLGTAGDKAVHVITLAYPSLTTAPTVTDGTPINPALPSATTNGTNAVPNLIVQRPRRVNS